MKYKQNKDDYVNYKMNRPALMSLSTCNPQFDIKSALLTLLIHSSGAASQTHNALVTMLVFAFLPCLQDDSIS